MRQLGIQELGEIACQEHSIILPQRNGMLPGAYLQVRVLDKQKKHPCHFLICLEQLLVLLNATSPLSQVYKALRIMLVQIANMKQGPARESAKETSYVKRQLVHWCLASDG
jgi:hypothetical protein